VLVHHTDTGVHGIARTREDLLYSIQDDASLIRLIKAIEEIHEGRLARTILTEEGMDLTGLNDERNVVVSDNGTKALGHSLKFKLHCPVPFCEVKTD
jgi:hypothetical protein